MKEAFQHQSNSNNNNGHNFNNNSNHHQIQQSSRLQRKKELESIVKNPKSLLSIDGLLDGITALVFDCEPMKKNKNIDNFLSRCKFKKANNNGLLTIHHIYLYRTQHFKFTHFFKTLFTLFVGPLVLESAFV